MVSPSLFSLFWVFSLMGHVYQRPYKKSCENVLKLRSVSIFSVARDDSIALRFLSKASILKFLKSLNTVCHFWRYYFP